MADPNGAQVAARLFAQHIPAIFRCGIPPQWAIRHPWLPVLVALLGTGVSVAIFVSGICLVTSSCFGFTEPQYPPRGNIVADFGIYGTYGGLIRWNRERAEMFILSVTAGQLALSISVWGVYAVAGLRRGVSGKIIRRLGALAACTVPPLLLVPFFVILLWQALNVLAPRGLPSLIDFRIGDRHIGPFYDWVQGIGVLLLMLSCIWVAVWIVKRHGLCRKSVRQALLGVRADDTDAAP